ncbi:hypothetical protein HS088_TW10G00395 [Tripterygium wilfordii]|uniref:WLM domain-containing protein n=1 Tax=Tripterygium wilfordii TaxID=458696 RepID=A0A7J7D539_TRIWF|nr:uncharacterized protein LOC120007219 [Tripterygium wilfordii]XP_038713357.1 uncharacterized protein LOC120007219 [Tripterygium wilfordii]XP_038713358.1 uncharacterized protein LOC120007219 [Tripterygium wilfordii]KAF5741398.1 hypothetical protein HS088_TW10G00395 [Tripterygium wilfordii]
MENPIDMVNFSVLWRGNKYVVDINSDASLKDLGDELQRLTAVKTDTLRLIIPQKSIKSSKLFYPFSEEHSSLILHEASITEGTSIRMMGVSENEVDKLLEDAKANLRIAGFDEEEKRMRQRISGRPSGLLKLPQGSYIFCDFRTLELPGVELNPPASEALKRMHMLAADPGVVAIMNKHRWRVGIMTEMAPVGYVGVSPKCILGFNKNHGEEISLRLRTDDLKGFRKYESIKKTLLHELAHMVYSEHDANFYALDKQLNQEAFSLDWTKSRGHTLSGRQLSEHYEDDFHFEDHKSFVQKLGGTSERLASARDSSVVAALRRLANASGNSFGESEIHKEPDPDDSGLNAGDKPDHMVLDVKSSIEVQQKNDLEPDPDDHIGTGNKFEPDPDDSQDAQILETDNLLRYGVVASSDSHHAQTIEVPESGMRSSRIIDEPGPYSFQANQINLVHGITTTPSKNDSQMETAEGHIQLNNGYKEIGPGSQANGVLQAESFPDDNHLVPQQVKSRMQIDEPDPDDQELSRILDPVTVLCGRLQKAIETLQAELRPMEATSALQTLYKIIRNVIEHPDEMKFKRLRKANSIIQRDVAKHKAAMEIMFLIGFGEDVISDEFGKAETYLVLKRNDPGLFWLAKSLVEACIAC